MGPTKKVLRDSSRIIEAIRRHAPFYAGDFAPVRTDQISELLKKSGCALLVFPFESCEDGPSPDPAFVMPPVFGINLICIDQNASRTDRQYAIRHELTHVYADEVREITYLSDSDYMSSSERVADLVAFADLVPGWWIRMLRDGGETWNSVRNEIRAYVADFSDGRSVDWVDDRAVLRMRLFRECSI